MNEKRRNQRKEVKWQPVSSERDGSLSVISFHNLVRTDYLYRIADRSVIGIGIETFEPVRPGIVWFGEPVYGQKCGVLLWCHETGDRYRCGIRFVSLTRTEEDYFRYQIEQVKPYAQFQDPDRIIELLNDCMLKS